MGITVSVYRLSGNQILVLILFEIFKILLSICCSLPGVIDGQGLRFGDYSIGPLSQENSINHR